MWNYCKTYVTCLRNKDYYYYYYYNQELSTSFNTTFHYLMRSIHEVSSHIFKNVLQHISLLFNLTILRYHYVISRTHLQFYFFHIILLTLSNLFCNHISFFVKHIILNVNFFFLIHNIKSNSSTMKPTKILIDQYFHLISQS